MRCLKCGFVNDEQQKYCFFCGTPIAGTSLPVEPAFELSVTELQETSSPEAAVDSHDAMVQPVEDVVVEPAGPQLVQEEIVPEDEKEMVEKAEIPQKASPLKIVLPEKRREKTVPAEGPKLRKRLRILVVGGYGFIGAAIAERCHQEGHQIFILDNLSTGSKKRLSFKHTFYQQNIEDAECDEIFKSNRFDIVFHFASGGSALSREKSGGSINSHISGLVNLLELSSKYGVEKFMTASSAAVYGKNCDLPFIEDNLGEPASFLTVDQLTEEFYCRKWAEIYNLRIVIFRISDVYGPKETADGSKIHRALTKNSLQIEGDPYQTRDYVYIGDVADAIYRSIYRNTSEVLNISSNTETNFEELGMLLRELVPAMEILHPAGQQEDGPRICLDNTRAKKELNWKPRYSLKDGLTKTLQWERRHQGWDFKEEVAVTTETAEKSEHWPWLAYFENGLAFLLVSFVMNIVKYNADYHSLDLKIVYILMMGLMYGMVQSIIAAGLSIVLYIALAVSMGSDLLAMINDPISLGQILVYLLIGLYTGYSTDRRNRAITFGEMQLAELKEKNAFISELNHQNHLIQEELQNQIINFEDSYGKIYNITREIDSLEPENVINASVGLVEKVMKSESVSIYMVNGSGNFLRLVAKSKQLEIAKSIAMDQVPELAELIETKEIFVNKRLDVNLPMLMAPIIDREKIVAIVALHNLEFDNINTYYRNLFKVLVGFISSSLIRAYRYEEATYMSRRVNGTIVLTEESFKRLLQLRMEAQTKNISNVSILRIDEFDINNELLLQRLVNLIRDVDYIGYGQKGIYILLANANLDEAKFIVNRLEKHQLYARIVNDESERLLG